MKNRGKFIVFEGIDGSGKSTISKMLHERLLRETIQSHLTNEPTNGPIGSIIRNIITKRIQSDEKTIGALFVADRLDHILNDVNGMLKLLNNNIHVICDRYYYSSYAYHVPFLSLDYVIQANSICAELLRPDVVFYLDISPEKSLERIAKNRNFNDLFETKERIELVHQNYMNAIAKEGKNDNVIIIDADRSLEEIFDDIWQKTQRVIQY